MTQISVIMALPIIQSIKQTGFSLKNLCEILSIQEKLLADPDERITYDQYDRLMEYAVELTGNPFFGLHLGASYSLDDFGLVGYIIQNSRTIGQAFENYQRYNLILCSGIKYDLRISREEALFSFQVSDPSRKITYHLTDSLLSSIYQIIQKLSGSKQKIKHVSFPQVKPNDDAYYRNLFQTDLLYGQKHPSIIFETSVLDLPVLYRNRKLLQIMEAHAAKVMCDLHLEHSFSEYVSSTIIKKLDGRIPRIEVISKEIGVSIRSMQFKLKEEGTNYRELLAQIRKKMAEEYLKNPSFTITEISYVLGFMEPGAFHTAFKKWTGQTPGQYRKQHMPL